ncbi:MAG: chromosomal replication initiator DnaA [Paracoccaceae bacterium]
MAEQLGLDLPARPALGREDFMVAPSNALALAMIDAWVNWDLRKLVLSGPEGSGKTHLTHVWAADAGARIIPAEGLADQSLQDLAQGPVAVEDIPMISQDPVDQTALFHLHNMLAEANHPLLMTGEAAPNFWNLSLPDLQSRVDAAGHAELQPPDDTLLAAVLAKLFADRQIAPKPNVIQYLVPRIERSFAAAARVVAALDAQSLAQGKPVGRNMARNMLDNGDIPKE